MKTTLTKSSLLMLCLVAIASCAKAPSPTAEEIGSMFSGTPPRSAYPWVWWHWMDGNISKEGITKDLLWMNKVGVAGVHQFDAGGRRVPQIVEERVPYMSGEWKDAFRHALHLTDSLGMEVAVASSPGWSSTGGPWVPRENAMKKLVWRTVEVAGGHQEINLPEPFTAVGKYQDLPVKDASDIEPWYEDVATLAIRLPDKERTMEELGAKVSSNSGAFTLEMLSDGRLSTSAPILPGEKIGDSWIMYEFPKEEAFKAVTVASVAMRSRYIPVPAETHLILECSDDGKSFREVAGIPDNVVYSMTVDFPETRARFWRLSVLKGEGSYAKSQAIREFVLHPVSKVNHFEEKAAFAAQHDFMSFRTPDSPDAVQDVVVLDGPSTDGKIVCNLPEGRWRVYRFGQSLTGKKNHPAAPDATGLEVDKLDPEAWLDHFHKYIDMYKEASGGLVGSRGIQYILTDSYEAEQMTWTRRMREEFSARKGYDLLEWLPALTGEILHGSEETERFLWDWREVIGDLFAENYNRINDIVNEYGMRGRYTEAHELGRVFVGDGMDLKMTATVPMSAIWMEDTPTGHRISIARADIQESASVAHVFGQNIAAAESFTVSGIKGHAYTYCPENIKRTADLALPSGLNRFVFHDSAHQPCDDKVPGTGLFQYGQWFNRHETWASMARPWMDYLARSCFMLQQGRFAADVLWYYGEDNSITALYGIDGPEVPAGYSFDFINPKGLLGEVKVRNGRLVTRSGMTYEVLALGENCRRMSLPVLRRIVWLASKGATICGTLPEEPAGMNDATPEFARLRTRLQELMAGASAKEALAERQVLPDFTSTADSVAFIHRTLPGMDIYWVRNFAKGPDKISTGISLRTPGGKILEVWNPEDGGRYTAEDYEVTPEGLSTTLEMGRDDALFLVVKYAGEAAPHRNATPNVSLAVDGPWKVRFQEGRGAPEEVLWDELSDWSLSPDEGIRYFSGVATYSSTIEIGGDVLASGKDLTLDLGAVKNVAEVSVNGVSCGTAWRHPFVVKIPCSALKEGSNEISVRVANLWVNRIIGDRQPGCKVAYTTTTQPFFTADSPLLPSGLLGPVMLWYNR